MTVSEIDTFYFKFKNLLLAEKNATLTLRSEDGRAQVTLSVDLGHLLPGAVPQHHLIRAEIALPEFDDVNDVQK